MSLNIDAFKKTKLVDKEPSLKVFSRHVSEERDLNFPLLWKKSIHFFKGVMFFIDFDLIYSKL